MAEWSKALDLSSSILRMRGFEPLSRHRFAIVAVLGATTTRGSSHIPQKSSWPNWIRRETTNLEIEGSSPSEDVLCFDGLVGYDDRLTRGRCPVRSRVEVRFGYSKEGQWSSGMILASGARGREFDSPLAPFCRHSQSEALVAQLAAHWSYEPMVQGSSPCRSSFGIGMARWWSGLTRWF